MSATMAKKKNPTDQSQPDRHKNRLVGLRLTPDDFDALRAYAEQEQRSMAQAAAILLREKMVEKGIVPPLRKGTKE
jgi:hypothetical protein